MNNNNRLLALEKKDISARFDAAIKAYFDWKSATETDDEIIADLRLAYPEMDDSNLRVLVVKTFADRGLPLEIHPSDEKIMLAQWQRCPADIVDGLRAVGLLVD